MSGLRKFAASSFHHALILEALFVLALTRIGLLVCHFRRVRRLSLLIGDCGRRITQRGVSPAVLVWAVETAKRKIPLRSTCFTEALAAEALFRQHGHHPVLCIGASMEGGRFAAHAWLENDETIVVGGPEAHIKQYTRFPDLDNIL